ncbi:MAG TPA: phosphoenolpyruvate carboxykinase, partial [Polyangiaceae bacterium]|nr:phosphoenolpyruvate carboxykinase [Polyangiaceae bacterium]
MLSSSTHHTRLLAWVKEVAALCKPDSVYFCDGSDEENERLLAGMLASGTLLRLNAELRPNSFLCRS